MIVVSAAHESSEITEHMSLLQTKAQIRNGRNMFMHERASLLERTTTNSTVEQSSGWLSMQQLADMVGNPSAQSKSKITSTVVLQNHDNAGLPKHGFVHFLTEGKSEQQAVAAKIRQRVVKTIVAPPRDVIINSSALTQPAQVFRQLAEQRVGGQLDIASNASGAAPTVEAPASEWDARSAEVNESHSQQILSTVPRVEESIPKPPPSMDSLHALSPVVEERLNVLVRDALDIRGVFAALQTGAAGVGPADNSDNEVPSLVPPLAFIKTHRTGSSSIANIIYRLGDERSLSFLLPTGDEAQALGWPGPFPGPDLEAKPTHSFDIICNEAVFAEEHMRRFLKPSPLFFTVLRQPLSQLQSSFEFFNPPCGNDWDARMVWLEKVMQTQDPSEELGPQGSDLVAQFRNSQAHDLGWYERQGHSIGFDQDDKAINTWLEEIHESLGFVMLTEYFNEGLVLLGRKLGLQVRDLAHVRLQSGGEGEGRNHSGGFTPEQARRVEGLAHVDVLLYSRFNRTFWHAWDQAGGYDELDGELQELRFRNEALEDACSKKNEQVCSGKFRMDSVGYTAMMTKKRNPIEVLS